ncbi:MAG: 2-hydroxychromene-2-carboxylate isomerase [Burkholderiales bacterium]|jgi:2-hydroxychromene-2-carboxylate isomerase|nr:2-hydroxychromene-2-carboxylate isomerase [Burkholderiales bacterium]
MQDVPNNDLARPDVPGPVIVDFWYEFASTYSFLAAERIEALAASRGVGLRWRPFLLGPIFRAQGYTTTPFLVHEAKGRYMWRDIERWCQRLGLPFVQPAAFPLNGLAAARVALALPDEARPAFTKAVYRRAFCEGRDIADETLLAEVVRTIDVELEPALTAARTDLVKHALRRQTETAVSLGIFGAPTLVTAGGELFWGNDRLDEALDWAFAEGAAKVRLP